MKTLQSDPLSKHIQNLHPSSINNQHIKAFTTIMNKPKLLTRFKKELSKITDLQQKQNLVVIHYRHLLQQLDLLYRYFYDYTKTKQQQHLQFYKSSLQNLYSYSKSIYQLTPPPPPGNDPVSHYEARLFFKSKEALINQHLSRLTKVFDHHLANILIEPILRIRNRDNITRKDLNYATLLLNEISNHFKSSKPRPDYEAINFMIHINITGYSAFSYCESYLTNYLEGRTPEIQLIVLESLWYHIESIPEHSIAQTFTSSQFCFKQQLLTFLAGEVYHCRSIYDQLHPPPTSPWQQVNYN